MSLAISANTIIASGACTCGTCAACAPRRVAATPAAHVADVLSTRVRADRFEASGLAPADRSTPSDSDTADPSPWATTVTTASDAQDNASSDEQQDQAARLATKELTPDERQMVAELQLRDRQVRAHEAAHKAAGGAHVGGASYTFQQGPDGRQYAIGGEVPVDLSTSGGSPEAVIAQMEQVRAAAMAPGDPSPQDYAVAAAAEALAAQARRDQQVAKAEPSSSAGPGQAAQRSDAATKPDQPSASGASAPEAAPLLGASAAQEGANRQHGRVIAAYRKAQEAQVAQGLLNQQA